MRTLFSQSDRQALLERLVRITPDARAEWGTMNAPKMLAHIGDQLRVALGDIDTRPRPGPMNWPILRHLVCERLENSLVAPFRSALGSNYGDRITATVH